MDDDDDDDAELKAKMDVSVNMLILRENSGQRIHLSKKSKEGYSSLQASLPSPLRKLTYHMGSHSVTCHPAEVTFPPLPQPKLRLDSNC